MSLCESAASRNNSLSQPTHIPAWCTGKGQQHRGLRRVLDSSSRIASRGPIEIKSSQGLMRNPTGYALNVVHGQSTTMLSNVASPGKRSRVSSKKEGKKMQTQRSILWGHRCLRDSKKRGSRWQWRLHFEASKHEEYGWLKQLMRSTNLRHLRFNIFIQRHNCGQSGFYRFTTPTHREMKTTQRMWYHMKSWIRWRILGGSSKGASEEDFKRIVNFRSDFMKPPRGSVEIPAMARSWRYALTNQVQWYSDPMRGGPSQYQLVQAYIMDWQKRLSIISPDELECN